MRRQQSSEDICQQHGPTTNNTEAIHATANGNPSTAAAAKSMTMESLLAQKKVYQKHLRSLQQRDLMQGMSNNVVFLQSPTGAFETCVFSHPIYVSHDRLCRMIRQPGSVHTLSVAHLIMGYNYRTYDATQREAKCLHFHYCARAHALSVFFFLVVNVDLRSDLCTAVKIMKQ